MRDENRNYLGACGFFLLIVAIVIVGSGLIYYQKKLKNQEVTTYNENEQEKNKMKKDQSQDYIYFTNEEKLVEDNSIIIKNPIINLNSKDANDITKKLENEVIEIKGTIKESKDIKENIAIFSFLEYSTYSYQDYVTLVVQEMEYDENEGILPPTKLEAYTFSIKTGEIVPFSTILENKNMKKTNIIEKIQKDLQLEKVSIKKEELESILNENINYIILLNNDGNLELKYIVKIEDVAYNGSIILNE